MEITNEIKSKVFAQYLGQKITLKKHGLGEWLPLTIERLQHGFEFDKFSRQDVQLILKPLIEMTGEEAIEVCKLQQEFKEQTGIKVGFGIDEKNNGCLDCIIEWDGYKHDYWQPVYSPTYQFLQSKGYDLPQYLLNGKTLHEVGLAIYEN